MDVDTAKARADWRGDRAFERALGAADAFHHRVGQRSAEPGHHIDSGLLHVPIDFDARRIDALAGRLGQLGAGAVAGNQRDFMSHVSSFVFALNRW